MEIKPHRTHSRNSKCICENLWEMFRAETQRSQRMGKADLRKSAGSASIFSHAKVDVSRGGTQRVSRRGAELWEAGDFFRAETQRAQRKSRTESLTT